MYWLKHNKLILISLSLLLLACIPALLPLLKTGFFVTDDAEWMIIRFSAFYQALADGQFPVRFLHRLNFDFGYPVATFLYPGFMYAGIIFHLFKIGVVETIKILLGLSLVGTTFFTYLWLRKLFSNQRSALLGALFSLYVPYHLYDVYTRGSMGEVFGLLWVPFILWMIERKSIFFLSIGIGLLLISHNTLAMLFLPMVFFYAIVRKKFRIRILLLSFFLGISLSAFFIVPVITELQYTRFAQTKIANPFEYFASLSLIGIATFTIVLLAGVLYISRHKYREGHKRLIKFFLTVSIASIILSSSVSTVIWQNISSSFIQFPFRFLSYLIISLAFLAAFVANEMRHFTKKIVILGGLLLLLILSAFPYMTPKMYFDKGEGYYVTNDATTTVQDEYMPKWVAKKPFQRPENKVEILQGQAEIKNLVYNNKQVRFSIDANDTARVRINTIYWPGWEVYRDNQKIPFSYENTRGVMEFIAPPGMHTIRAEFGETSARLTGNIISVLSFIILSLYSLGVKLKLPKIL